MAEQVMEEGENLKQEDEEIQSVSNMNEDKDEEERWRISLMRYAVPPFGHI